MNDGSTITEQAGYIPPRIQIENMINAGKRLDQYRKEMYDFPPDAEVPDDFEDPTRNPGFDMADATKLAREIRTRLRSAKASPQKDTAVPPKVDPEPSGEGGLSAKGKEKV
jgi:hypothetical protein